MRPQSEDLLSCLCKPRRFLQIGAAECYVGKTTLAPQFTERWGLANHLASAYEPTSCGPEWIAGQ